MVHRPTRTHLIQLGIAFAAGVVVILLVLIGFGVLVVPSSTSGPATVTVTEVQWTILQGTNANGHGWFGNSTINETDQDGLPLQVASGATFTISVVLLNTGNHPIYSVLAAAPFREVRTVPLLPTTPTGVDDFILKVTVAAPSVSSDTSYVVALTVNALTPP